MLSSSSESSDNSQKESSQRTRKISKHASRIAAVQIMYQLDIMGGEPSKAVENFLSHYADTEEILLGLNKNFLRRLISHCEEPVDFDKIISAHLSKAGSLSLVPSLALSLLKVSILEMIFEKTDIPVIINEYVNVAKCFLDQKAISFINAVLDKISKTIERKALCPPSK